MNTSLSGGIRRSFLLRKMWPRSIVNGESAESAFTTRHGSGELKYLQQAPARVAEQTPLFGEQPPVWGGVFTRFEDLDHNSFALVSIDEISRSIERQRRAIAARLEAERRARMNWKSQSRFRPGYSRRPCRKCKHSRFGNLHSGTRGRRRLLRLSQPGTGPAGFCACRYFRKRNRSRPHHGKPAQNVRERSIAPGLRITGR